MYLVSDYRICSCGFKVVEDIKGGAEKGNYRYLIAGTLRSTTIFFRHNTVIFIFLGANSVGFYLV